MLFAFRIGSSPGGDADLALTGLTVDGSSRVGVFQQITHLIFQAALAAQHPAQQVDEAVLTRLLDRMHYVGGDFTKPDELLAGARVEVDEAKEDPRDFVLVGAGGATAAHITALVLARTEAGGDA